MKIIQVTPCFPPNGGGIGSYVYNLSHELLKKEYKISIVLRGKQNRFYNYNGIKVTELKIPGWPPFNLRTLKRKIEQIVLLEKPDIVHIHHGAMPVPETDKPVLLTAHCCNKELIRNLHRPIRNLENLYRNTAYPFYVKAESKAVKSNRLTVVSESLHQEFGRHYNVSSSVVHNGVDPSLFKPSKKTKKENMILFTGRLSRGKGLFDLIRVAELLIKTHCNTRISIAGEGPLKNALIRKLKRRKLSNTKIIPYLSHNKLADVYQRAKVFILPTYYEGMSTSVLEAMACKLPVVSTRIPGMPELVEDGINGYLLSTGNIEGFYSRIVELLDNEEKQRQFGEAGRRKVISKFLWPHVADLITAQYNLLLET